MNGILTFVDQEKGGLNAIGKFSCRRFQSKNILSLVGFGCQCAFCKHWHAHLNRTYEVLKMKTHEAVV